MALLLVALLPATAGCGAAQREAASETTSTYEIVVSAEWGPTPDVGTALPSEMCFVAVRNYELGLMVQENGSPGLCEQLEGYLPRGAGRAGWPIPETGNEDEDTPNLECAVGGSGVRVEVLTWNRDSTTLFGTDVCETMIRDGWELQPLFEFGDEEPMPGTCFVATARYEVELAGETERGQELCEEVARSHLPAPIVHRSMPVAEADAMGNTVCEAARRGDRMKLISMPADRGAIDLDAVCDSLEQDGWKVVRWGRP